MERRQFFRGLIAAGATVAERPERRNRRAHHEGQRVYHGPMSIPEEVARIVADHPAIKRTTHRHLVSRYAADGYTWLFRCQIPAHRGMVGEIIHIPQPDGVILSRVHCWSAADPDRAPHGGYLDAVLISASRHPVSPLPHAAILPPLPEAEYTMAEYTSPAWLTEAPRENTVRRLTEGQ
jgi:hypothetical protein